MSDKYSIDYLLIALREIERAPFQLNPYCQQAADEIEQYQAQIDALQQKVHLCTAYDKLESALKKIHKFAASKYGSPDASDGWLKIMQLSDPGSLLTKGSHHEHKWLDDDNGWKRCECGAGLPPSLPEKVSDD